MIEPESLIDWRKTPAKAHDLVNRTKAAHANRQKRDEYFLGLYHGEGSVEVVNRAGRDYTFGYEEGLTEQGENLQCEVVDSAVAQIASRPLQASLTDNGGEADMSRACSLASALINGVFAASDFVHRATEAYRDGCNTSVGWVMGWYDEGSASIKFSRKLPGSVYWVEDGTDRPRVMFVEEAVPRANLQANRESYVRGATKKAIEGLDQWIAPVIPGIDGYSCASKDADTVRVVEIWCTTLGKDKGRHQLLAGTSLELVLIDEEYELEIHQLIPFRWKPGHKGFAGVSLAQTIAVDHVRNNLVLARIDGILEAAGPKIVASTSALQDAKLSELDYEKIPYPDGMIPPQVVVPDVSVIVTQLLQENQRRRTSAFAKAGINKDVSAGEKPTGLNSGRALREFRGIANERLVTQQAAYEKLWTDAARLIIALAKTAYKTEPAKVRAPGTDLLQQITWSEIDLQEDQYRLSFSLLPGAGVSQAEKLEDLNDLQASGAIDQMDVLCNMDAPDTVALRERVTAMRQLINRVIAKALRYGQITVPSSSWDLASLARIGQEWLAVAELKGTYPEKGVKALRVVVENARAKAAPAPAAPAAPVAAPMAA